MNIIRKPFRYTFTNAALILIGINVIIFALQMIFRYGPYDQVGTLLALNPARIIQNHWYWQFVTYMFAHSTAGWSHLLFNMLALFLFGTALERHIGSKEFLLYYFVTGVLAGALSFCLYLFTGMYMVSLLGASGAIFAVQLAYAAMFPNSYIYVWGIIPLRAPVMVLLFTGIELFSGLFSLDNVAHATHLFGFLSGTLYCFIRWGANPFKLMFSRR